ncbi:MAG: type I DNA topoisomerase [Oscillospiraceae bacterium]|nr:type I DNA topoisomerase [Clostridiaceae bacterium]MDY5888835.1 type I DNA topoisomerase [Oscillospiraceae bacterium]MDY5934771.1 type I DNA topoisomerase [Oscillospiraceae bacterium]
MSKLVIVESPTKVKTVKKYLGDGYNVTASMGHVRDLPAAKLSVDIKNDFAPKYAVIKGKEKLVKELKGMVAESDEVYLATDPDREGEAISWHLATLLGLDMDKTNRITFNEITKTGIENGMKQPRSIDMNLVNAQQARRILDRLVGYKLSPFISQKIRRGLSAGRVQSVAVRLIVDRENEIRAFVPEEYWTLDAKFTAPNRKSFSASFYGDETGKVKITSKEQADEYLARLDNAKYSVTSVKKGTRKKNPAPPFITSTLQQEASRRMGFQAQRTMRAAQELYEGVDIAGIGTTGLITYMRTDSLRISEEARAATNSFILQTYGEKYLPEKPRYFKSRSNAQDGHEAIRPTNPALTPDMVRSSLTSDQYKLYTLIWKRFVASLMATCIQNTVKAEIDAVTEGVDGYCRFTAAGYSVKFDGYTVLYEESTDEEEDAEGKLPEINTGDKLKLKELKGNQHFTQPPARYTEASLIKALEENGIGRPSTYATIITTIVKREYVKRQQKQLYPTELGEAITKLLKEKFSKIVNTKFTAGMETKLDEVGEGKEDYIAMLHEFYDEFDKNLQKVKAEMKDVKIQLDEDVTDIPCEKCGRMMVVKVGRYGKFLACPGYPECKNAKPLVTKTNAKCPKCGGEVIEKKSKKGYTFYGCSNWPDCDFMTWDKPTDETCPECGKSLFKRKGGLTVCLGEGCGFERKTERKSRKKEDQ